MSADVFTLQVYSPLGVAVQELAKWAKVPTAMGEITVLPVHCSYVGLLGVGVLEYQGIEAENVRRIIVCRGAASFADNHLRIIADALFEPGVTSHAEFADRKRELQQFLEGKGPEQPEYKAASDQLLALELIDKYGKMQA